MAAPRHTSWGWMWTACAGSVATSELVQPGPRASRGHHVAGSGRMDAGLPSQPPPASMLPDPVLQAVLPLLSAPQRQAWVWISAPLLVHSVYI